jgi:SAM-dependent methyltransferase
MSEVPSDRYDTILCSEVLEHVPRPDDTLSELHRVLRPEGNLILSVPFLSRLHEEPYDYFRFTEHGLKTLLARHGFTVRRLLVTGGPFSFVGHQVSSAVVLSVWGVPLLGELALLLNAALVVAPSRALDAVPGLARKLPSGYVVTASKARSQAPSI